MRVCIEGLRFSGKTTLISVLATMFFKENYSVSIIPEWRFSNNGPSDTYEWIKSVFFERNYLESIAQSCTTSIVLSDRSLIDLEAFLLCDYPEQADLFFCKKDDRYIPDMNIFLYADKKVLTQRAALRDSSNLLNNERIIDFYYKIYQRYNIEPVIIDTSSMSKMELANMVYDIIISAKQKETRVKQ